MKKFLLIIISLAAIFCGAFISDIRASAEKADSEFYSYLLDGIEEYKTEIDIVHYVKKNNWDIEDIKFRLKYFYLSEPELFYVGREVGILYSEDFTHLSLKFNYLYEENEAEKMKADMKKAGLRAVQNITDDMTDAEKALIVHDYLIMNVSYDHSEQKYTAYECLVEESAVCQGYSLAYMYIMRDILGMQCSVVFTDTQNHAWNYIRIGNFWYHVDLTADDPTFVAYGGVSYDGKGEILHENFMLSDEAFYKSSPLHRDWNTMGKPAAKNRNYDNFFWKDCTSAIYKIGDLWYYTVVDKSSPGLNYSVTGKKQVYTKLRSYNFKTGKIRNIRKINSRWSVYRRPDTGELIEGESWYSKSYSKVVVRGSSVYFNTSKNLYRYNTKTGKLKKVFSLSNSDSQIFSIIPRGKNGITLVCKNDLSYKNSYINLKIS